MSDSALIDGMTISNRDFHVSNAYNGLFDDFVLFDDRRLANMEDYGYHYSHKFLKLHPNSGNALQHKFFFFNKSAIEKACAIGGWQYLDAYIFCNYHYYSVYRRNCHDLQCATFTMKMLADWMGFTRDKKGRTFKILSDLDKARIISCDLKEDMTLNDSIQMVLNYPFVSGGFFMRMSNLKMTEDKDGHKMLAIYLMMEKAIHYNYIGSISDYRKIEIAQETIAATLGFAPNTVRKYTEKLSDIGYIKVEQAYNPILRKYECNKYTLFNYKWEHDFSKYFPK